MKTLTFAVRQPLKLIGLIEGRELLVEFTIPATAALEEKLGRTLKGYMDWVQLKAKELESVLAAGLLRYQPEDAEKLAATVSESAWPELQEQILEAICAHAWPEATERAAKALEQWRKDRLTGKTEKNG
jgi:hypothetical protein